jgi:hypothetical protein
VTKERWPQILKQQANRKSVTILNDSGSNDLPLRRELFGTNLNPNIFNIRILSTQQLTTATTMMNVNPLMVVVLANVLRIQLLKHLYFRIFPM